MKKQVLDVGNCSPDFASLNHFFTEHFDCEVTQAHGLEDALAELRKKEFSLVTVNRKLDQDYSDGIEIIKVIKANEQLRSVPVMLITNFPEHQDAAEEIGAERGFGKLELNDETAEKIAPLLA